MKATEFRKLIREEVRKVLKEVEESAAPFYYMQFNGTVQPMGPSPTDPTGRDRSDRVSRGPLNKPTDVLNVRRFPKNSWKEMDIYKMMINKKPGYVLISADNRSKWAIIPVDAKFNASVTSGEKENYHYSYKMAFDAVTTAKEKGQQIAPEEFLNSLKEVRRALKEAIDPNATYKVNVGMSRGEFDPSDIKKVSGQPSMVAKAVMKMAYDDLIDADYEEDEILSEYVRMFKLDEYTYYIMTGEEDVVVVGSPKSKKYGKFWSLIETDPEAAESMFEDIEEDSTNADEIELK